MPAMNEKRRSLFASRAQWSRHVRNRKGTFLSGICLKTMRSARLIISSLLLLTLLTGCLDRSDTKPSAENARRALILRGIEYNEASLWLMLRRETCGPSMHSVSRDESERQERARRDAARGGCGQGRRGSCTCLLAGKADINSPDRDKRTFDARHPDAARRGG